MKVSYSAPAKIILSGEHSVVYGKPALVSAIDVRLTFTVQDSQSRGKLKPPVEVIKKIVIEYLKQNNIPYSEKPFTFHISSDIPSGRGMGSSAAFSVAGVSALLDFFTGKEFEKTVINQLAYKVEKYFHGNPSGVDSSASSFGGLIFFRKEFEFLKQISSLNFKIPQNILSTLYIIDSGKPKESTSEMVAAVGKMYNKNPKDTDDRLCQLERVTKRMVVSIVKEDHTLFLSAVKESQTLLQELDVVSEKTQEMLERLSQFGVGKVTGAGGKNAGSGFILFTSHDNKGLEEHLKKNSIPYFQFNPALEGVQKV